MRTEILSCLLVGVALGGQTALGQGMASVNPHGDLELSCIACHTTEAWKPLKSQPDFDHDTQTRFELVGSHSRTPCRSCHVDLRFDLPRAAPDECAACHLDVHQGQFVQPCTDCHNNDTFSVTDGDALHSRTSFPLTGAHRQIACEQCHVDDRAGAYGPLDTACLSCHEADFTGAPGHVSLGYPEDCSQCHGPFSWKDGVIDHTRVSGGFALVGAHERASCESCHTPGSFEPIFDAVDENDCAACHRADYDAEHAGSGFPETCLTCHDENTWTGAVFDHDGSFFPIYTGKHREEWTTCEDCHSAAPASYQVFSCLDCHQHERGETDDDHSEVGDYLYESSACLTCHPDGED